MSASTLGKRVLTALVLIPLVVFAVLASSNLLFAALLAVIFLIASLEWSRLAQFERGPLKVLVPITLALLLVLGYMLHLRQDLVLFIAVCGLGYWLLSLFWVVQFERTGRVSMLESASVRFAAGIMTLVPAWISLVMLHEMDPPLVMYVLLLMWFADSGAYFAGRRFGKMHLAANVSPGKTREGVTGGVVAVLVLALAVVAYKEMSLLPGAGFVLLSIFVALISVLGDLVESLFKRRAGLKDSGKLLPGHGGILDRLDSLMAAAPGFAVGWLLLEGMR